MKKPSKRDFKRRALWAGIVALLGYSFMGGEHNLYNYWKVSQKEQRLRHELVTGQNRRLQLAQEVYRLKNDPQFIEKIARENYNMGKQGETIYLIKQAR